MNPVSITHKVAKGAYYKSTCKFHQRLSIRYKAFATMSGGRYLSHEERTAEQPRDPDMHAVVVSQIALVNSNIRTLRLRPEALGRSVKFLPGQWLDVHIPGLSKAGGFSLTSIPADADVTTSLSAEAVSMSSPSESSYLKVIRQGHESDSQPFLELAVQDAPKNPPAAWLWRPFEEVVGQRLHVRVGGSFVWPPFNFQDTDNIKKVILIAGGVGINPLISILTHLHHTSVPLREIVLLYATKVPEIPENNLQVDLPPSSILFFPRLLAISAASPTIQIKLFLTGKKASSLKITQSDSISSYCRRISQKDLIETVGDSAASWKELVVYVCGPKQMTDETIAFLGSQKGSEGRILSERWW